MRGFDGIVVRPPRVSSCAGTCLIEAYGTRMTACSGAPLIDWYSMQPFPDGTPCRSATSTLLHDCHVPTWTVTWEPRSPRALSVPGMPDSPTSAQIDCNVMCAQGFHRSCSAIDTNAHMLCWALEITGTRETCAASYSGYAPPLTNSLLAPPVRNVFTPVPFRVQGCFHFFRWR